MISTMSMEDTKEHRTYELGALLKDEKGREEILHTLTSNGAAIKKEGKCARVDPVSQSSKEKEAYFCVLHFVAAPHTIAEIFKALGLNAQVLRFLVFNYSPREERAEASKLEEQTKESAFPSRAPDSHAPRKKLPAISELSNEELEQKLEEILK